MVYSGHSPSQYVDGLRGPLIVHDSKGPYAGQYDEELVVSISDWYHGNTLSHLRCRGRPVLMVGVRSSSRLAGNLSM